MTAHRCRWDIELDDLHNGARIVVRTSVRDIHGTYSAYFREDGVWWLAFVDDDGILQEIETFRVKGVALEAVKA